MSVVFPKMANHPAWGVIGARAVTDAWGGAALDAKRGIMVFTGGGHADYGGNEVYHFDIESLKWTRATEPSALRDLGAGRFEVVEGEAPVSSHTYSGLIYLPTVERILKFGGSYYKVGSSYDKHAYYYDTHTRQWKRAAKAPLSMAEVAGDFDAVTGNAVFSTGTGLMFFDPIKDEWKLWRQLDGQSFASSVAVTADPQLLVQMRSREGHLEYYRLDKAGPRTRAPVKGASDWPAKSGMSLHTPSGKLVLWGGGREVWVVSPKDWVITKLDNAAGPAPEAKTSKGTRKSSGIYGRWRYVAKYDVFIGYAHAYDNVWVYKLPKEVGAPARN